MNQSKLRCRFCGVDCEKRNHVNIFNRNNSFVPLLIEKVLRYFPYMDDGLSKFMCTECLAKMDKIKTFLDTSINYLFNAVNETHITKKPCNLCGRVWNHKVNSYGDDNITSKLSFLFGYSIAKLRSICLICVSKIHVFHKFINMIDSTLSTVAEEQPANAETNSRVKIEIVRIKQEVDDVGSCSNENNINAGVGIKEEIITDEIQPGTYLNRPFTTISSTKSGMNDHSMNYEVEIKEEIEEETDLDKPPTTISRTETVENEPIAFIPNTIPIKNKSRITRQKSKQTQNKPRITRQQSRRKKVVNYFEDDSSNPDSPDSSMSGDFQGGDLDSEDDSSSSDEQKNSVEQPEAADPNPPTHPTPPKNNLVKDLRKLRSSQQHQPPAKITITQDSTKRIVIKKGEETKPSLHLICTKKKIDNGKSVTYVTIRSEYMESVKHITPLLGDEVYYTWNDHARTNDQVKYKNFVIKCIENILQGQANIMPYLKMTVQSGVKRLMFTCFVCGTPIHNNMIRQSINAHLIMHMVMLCPMCGQFKTSISDMNHHLKTHSKSIYNCKFQCKMCSKEITSGPEVYFTHVMSHFQLYNCVKCNYSTDDIQCFTKHHDTVCGKGDCKGDCSNRYKTHEELMRHLDGLGSGEVQPSYACANCKIAFHSRELAGMHFDIHGHQHCQIERMRITKEESTCVLEKSALLKRYESSRDYSDMEVDEENNSKCPFCSKCLKNTTSAYLNKHINLHILLACRACDNIPIYQEFIHYKNHVLYDHTLIGIECKLCDNLKFHDVDLYLSHIMQHI